MKTITLFCLFFLLHSGTTLASEKSRNLFATFTPNSNTLVELHYRNTDSAGAKYFERIKEAMAQKWNTQKAPTGNRQLISVYVAGARVSNGNFVSLPSTAFIESYFRGHYWGAMTNIKNTQSIINRVERIIVQKEDKTKV